MVARVRAALTAAEWRRAGLLAAVVLALHVVGFGLLVVAGSPLGAGVGITAYTLGLRHAFDADHIAAIDNTTRKLMGEGQRPLSVGFFFSLGHSTVVCALGIGVVLGVRGLGGAVTDDGSALHRTAGVVGPLVSGSFLFAIGLANLAILVSVIRVFRAMRAGEVDESALEERLQARGFLSRVCGRATRAVRRPWHMYPLGLLFGLGFDTATEVALLVLAGGAAAGGMPVSAILCLPILFAAGMSLLDTLDGAFMNFAYGWAFSRPVRKIYYNMTVTGLSVAVALLVGSVELLSVLGSRLGLSLDLNLVGYAIAALFAVTWAAAVALWRLGRIEERWAAADARKG
ncbi:MAG TPA: HoxN/HupN/NixA family nickel/cobalt transporter [Baekduia sp.]|uniref:HoxN/HupN/NixA family nickel/cobalt transporter n=1 Tax=Baekduia sp. TaxID=2600305 RepID=UPI002D79444D|nr:HoxN/HupN/NixA family nickel/cobalt transporter [Baekduia sp.]HET6505422.1 HoxN/HupN/NixA family nickel/cobalt transporter [Baekduia sp.]